MTYKQAFELIKDDIEIIYDSQKTPDGYIFSGEIGGDMVRYMVTNEGDVYAKQQLNKGWID